MVDSIVDREQLRQTLSDLLGRLSPQRQHVKFLRPRRVNTKPRESLDAWEAIQRVRRANRPTALDYVNRMTTGFVNLHGDRLSMDDPTIICGFGSLDGLSVVIIGQQRQAAPDGGFRSAAISPEGFRKVQRAMRLAAKFGMPLITLIDTTGPATSLEAEEHGIGGSIAATMTTMAGLPVPTISVIIGEGGREGALALSIADRILMTESAILSPISPEAAASLMYRDDTRADDAARSLRLTSADAMEMKIIDAIVPEPIGGPHQDHDEAARLLQRALVRALGQVQNISPSRLLSRRYKKFRNMGEYTSYFYAVLSREVDALQSYVVQQVKVTRTRRRRGRSDDGKILTLPVNQEQAAPPKAAADPPPPLEFPRPQTTDGASTERDGI
jgi:acetyl-CoA carboxylase carboxyl transferase subunit alpha